MNLSATISIFKLLRDPSLCLPQSTISTFNHLPIPLSKAFTDFHGEKKVDIRAVVLDKDNCFAIPRENTVYQPYNDKFRALKAAYPGKRLLIVSNSSGTDSDPYHHEADLLERNTGITVLRHSTKKPGCHAEILSFLCSQPSLNITSPSQIAVVGDRLFTDIIMANMMGSWGFWVKDGVVTEKGLFTRLEGRLSRFLFRRGYSAPTPQSIFED